MHTPTYRQVAEIINILKRVAAEMSETGLAQTRTNVSFLVQMCMPVLSKFSGGRFLYLFTQVNDLSEEFQEYTVPMAMASEPLYESAQEGVANKEIFNIFFHTDQLPQQVEKLVQMFREWQETRGGEGYEDICRILSPLGYHDYEVMGRALAEGKNEFFLFNLEDRHGMAGRLARVMYNLTKVE